MNTNTPQVLHSQRREMIQPMRCICKLSNLFISQTQRLHDLPLVLGSACLGYGFTLKSGLNKALFQEMRQMAEKSGLAKTGKERQL